VNYGVMYGMSAYGLARQLKIEAADAASFIQAYYARHPGVSSYLARVLDEGKEKGYVTTLLSRRRYLPRLASRNPRERAEAERAAINTPIQGTAADMIKVAMVRIDRALEEQGFAARMVLQVHDELVFDAPAGEIDRLAALVRETMEGALSLSVPILVDVRSGRSWAEIH
jgi:DNA polymerase-1